MAAQTGRTFSAETAAEEGFKIPQKLESFRPAEWKENDPTSATVSRDLYPKIEPFDTGYLPVGTHGHELYYEISGNPDGQPAVFLHGGPGGGCGAHTRQFFDPSYYRIVCFDQRGCHRSRPNAAEQWEASIAGNNTQELVEDIEVLRKHLSVDQWHVVLGGSWGSTLGVAYAQAHPDSLKALILRGVFLFTPGEIDYLFQNGDSSAHHPEAWDGYIDHIRSDPDGDWETERQNLLGAYYKRLCCGDQEKAEAAAKAFVRYELSISKTFPDPTKLNHTLETPSILIPFALFECHYMLNNGFLRRGELLDNVAKMKDLPVTIVHGRCDHVCQPHAAYKLYKALNPKADRTDVKLEIVSGAGHSDSEPGLIDGLVRATDEFRDNA
mmetsp:Transcript_70948/g.198963  ORF Transcript_70948/g.198963 Transcript_70948/m.198963 type:complete len:382 (-) Transcript_70948:433-1578(-)|eukprot:CAMPEP_0119510908 /NCGR_PEP_ID=MMETSP1344-20130328/29732_1 /TAXON_ID=236787 /ORGANISM="Florenciella parvula, Strain CCMP2471" /LENGTH=381 /DNA_ID=CAMNT_0007547861 /DNA_START=70 /DNA_END=1215 /DNA_ORIENTATION=+